MSNGIPLDTYLNGLGSPGGLTEQEIQEQLFPDVQLPAKSSPQAPAAGTTKPQPKPETDPLADLENRMAGIRTNSADDSDTDFVDSAIKSASHGVKVLAPLLAAATCVASCILGFSIIRPSRVRRWALMWEGGGGKPVWARS